MNILAFFALNPWELIVLGSLVIAGIMVGFDADRLRNQGVKVSPIVWGLCVAVALPIALPVYLILRVGKWNIGTESSTNQSESQRRPQTEQPDTTLRAACPCGRKIRLKPEMAGKKFRCPDCKQTLRAPGVN